ncbi:MAG: NAD(P)-binding domain-containing protein, partial [Candidatus Nanohaloarchaea archaeon]|nr:NAD(P)-binding domain-containing protein [Candidatus Nanohaloarchaea archaeon]
MNTEIGIVGLGKMGGNIARSLVEDGYDVVGYDIDPEAADAIDGVEPAEDHGELAAALTPPRLVWLSVPAGEAVDEALDALLPHLEEGDVVIDGGNSNFERTQERFERLQAENVHLLDAGCSGGPSGARNGLSIMVGGEQEVFEDVEEVFDLLSVEDGYAYFGDTGAGHYVKMVHNGVEYVMMQALGEGYQLLAEGPYD